MHQMAALHPAAEMLADRLVAEADAEQRTALGGAGGDEVERDAGVVGGLRPGRDQERLRARRQRLTGGDGVVADDLDLERPAPGR